MNKETQSFNLTTNCIVCGEEAGYEGIKAAIHLTPEDQKKIGTLISQAANLHGENRNMHLKTDSIGRVEFESSNDDEAPMRVDGSSISICVLMSQDTQPRFYWKAFVKHSQDHVETPLFNIKAGQVEIDKSFLPGGIRGK